MPMLFAATNSIGINPSAVTLTAERSPSNEKYSSPAESSPITKSILLMVMGSISRPFNTAPTIPLHHSSPSADEKSISEISTSAAIVPPLRVNRVEISPSAGALEVMNLPASSTMSATKPISM